MTERPGTRDRIVAAASKLYYAEGIGRVGLDAVAEKAGVTKRTIYYHFESKDALVAATLEARDQPNLALMAGWFAEAEGELSDKIGAIFTALARGARHPRWKGCAFLRTAAELAATPGHPAVRVGARHKSSFEAWLAGEIAADGTVEAPNELAREILLLMDGAFAAAFLRRDASFFEAAGRASARLVAAHGSPKRRGRSGRAGAPPGATG